MVDFPRRAALKSDSKTKASLSRPYSTEFDLELILWTLFKRFCKPVSKSELPWKTIYNIYLSLLQIFEFKYFVIASASVTFCDFII